MKSPLLGMDPYIEACGLWGDFHSHLIELIYGVLAEVVRQQRELDVALVGADQPPEILESDP